MSALRHVPVWRDRADRSRVADEPTIFIFRHLLKKRRLGEQILGATKAYLSGWDMTMCRGIIENVALIAAPTSTRNSENSVRHPKGSGLVHSVVTQSANLQIPLSPRASLNPLGISAVVSACLVLSLKACTHAGTDAKRD